MSVTFSSTHSGCGWRTTDHSGWQANWCSAIPTPCDTGCIALSNVLAGHCHVRAMSPNSASRWKFIAVSCGRRRAMIISCRHHEASVQFGCEPVDLPSELGVGLEFQFLCLEVVIGLRLLERG